MFKRIIYEDWVSIVPIVSFVLTAGVFLFASLRALVIPKQRRTYLASLPLNDSQANS